MGLIKTVLLSAFGTIVCGSVIERWLTRKISVAMNTLKERMIKEKHIN